MSICCSDDVLSPALKLLNLALMQLRDFVRLPYRSCVNGYLRGISLLAATDSYLAPGIVRVALLVCKGTVRNDTQVS